MNPTPLTQAWAALILTGLPVVACYLLAVAGRYHRAVQREAIRFRLFEVRDRLYLAAAEGKIRCESETFTRTRDAINHLIRESDDTGGNFLAAMFAAQADQRPTSILDGMPEAERRVYAGIFVRLADAMFDLLRLNSRMFRLLGALHGAVASVERRESLRSTNTTLTQLERVRHDFSGMAHAG